MPIDLEVIAKWIGVLSVIAGVFISAYKITDKHILSRIRKLEEASKKESSEMAVSKQERRILLEAQLACLKGLQEMGANGPVTKAISKIECFMIEKSHD